MLYISRCTAPGAYGVVDTDDGSEDVYNGEDIYAVCRELRLDIKGVVSRGLIFPWQDSKTVSGYQAKLLLAGIKTTVWNDIITSIRYENVQNGEIVPIRLSELGSSFGCSILFGNARSYRVQARLIFDDGFMPINVDTFGPLTGSVYMEYAPRRMGVEFDLSSVSDDELAMSVYKAVSKRYMSFVELSVGEVGLLVKDVPERKDAMLAMLR